MTGERISHVQYAIETLRMGKTLRLEAAMQALREAGHRVVRASQLPAPDPLWTPILDRNPDGGYRWGGSL